MGLQRGEPALFGGQPGGGRSLWLQRRRIPLHDAERLAARRGSPDNVTNVFTSPATAVSTISDPEAGRIFDSNSDSGEFIEIPNDIPVTSKDIKTHNKIIADAETAYNKFKMDLDKANIDLRAEEPVKDKMEVQFQTELYSLHLKFNKILSEYDNIKKQLIDIHKTELLAVVSSEYLDNFAINKVEALYINQYLLIRKKLSRLMMISNKITRNSIHSYARTFEQTVGLPLNTVLSDKDKISLNNALGKSIETGKELLKMLIDISEFIKLTKSCYPGLNQNDIFKIVNQNRSEMIAKFSDLMGTNNDIESPFDGFDNVVYKLKRELAVAAAKKPAISTSNNAKNKCMTGCVIS